MTFNTDIAKAEGVLGQMKQKFAVANPVGKPSLSSSADTWQMEVRREIVGADANFLRLNTVQINADFYSKYGDYLIKQTRSALGKTNLKCFDFNAYIARRLELAGFEGSIHKGLLGVSTMSGHEFLILFNSCGAYERILDYWSHLQTEASPICTLADYGQLLPQDKAMQTNLSNGIKVSTKLKDGPCPG